MDPRFAEKHHVKFHVLLAFLARVPAIEKHFGSGLFGDGNWWVKFSIDTQHELAWSTVQEMGFVLNYVSLDERLPTVFKPVSPPPYLNGGPEFLSWVIESLEPGFSPSNAAEWLEGRMPRPVEDKMQWPIFDTEDDEKEGG